MSNLNVLRNQLLVKGHSEMLHRMAERLGEDHPAVLKQSSVLAKKILSSMDSGIGCEVL